MFKAHVGKITSRISTCYRRQWHRCISLPMHRLLCMLAHVLKYISHLYSCFGMLLNLEEKAGCKEERRGAH